MSCLRERRVVSRLLRQPGPMLNVRVLLHTRERLFSASRSNRLCVYCARLSWIVAPASLCFGSQRRRGHSDHHGRRRDSLRNLVHTLLEGFVAGPGPHSASSYV